MTYYPHQVPVAPSELPGQFVLTTREALLPAEWRIQAHGRWALVYSAPLECIPIEEQAGRPRGWILGHAVDPEAGFLHPCATGKLNVPEGASFTDIMGRMAGRFLGVELTRSDPRIHPDPMATLAGVFAPEEGAVASTSSLIPVTKRTPFAVERILSSDIPYSAVMYPLGLTPRHGVDRLLPNHVLDLASWSHTRVWPLARWTRDGDPTVAVELVGRQVRCALVAMAKVYQLDFTLTAGRDSRMMFAAARDLSQRVACFTADLGDEVSWRDVLVGSRVAAKAGVPHRKLRRRRARRSDLRTWVARTGGETGEPRGWRGCRTLADQRVGWATITGAAADLTRLVGWRKQFLSQDVTPERILGRCNAPRRAEFIRRAADWLAKLPPLDPLAVADLVHLEQVEGCWAGVIEYGELGQSSARLCPACNRSIVEATVRLPVDYRIALKLHSDVIERLWPDLLDLPFNEEFPTPTWRRRFFAVPRRLSGPAADLARGWRKARASRQWLRERLS